MKIIIDAHVQDIRGDRVGDMSEKVSVCASYESANTLSSITFDVPINNARDFFVGQKIQINIEWLDVATAGTASA